MLKPRYPLAIPVGLIVIGIAIAMLMHAKLQVATHDADLAQNLIVSACGVLGGGLTILIGAFDPKWQYRMRKQKQGGDKAATGGKAEQVDE
jgi:hypothetical protein